MKFRLYTKKESVTLTHTAELIDLCSSRFAKERVLTYPHYKTDELKHITGCEFAQKCMAAAKALVAFGLSEQQAVGIYSPNRQEVLYCELGLFAIRGISVPFYFTASPDQVEAISKDVDLKLIFVGEQYQYNNAYQVQHEKGQIERIIIFDRRVVKQFDDHTSIYYDEFVRMGDSMRNESIVKQRKGESTSSDTALLIYTSGTCGEPKGVIIRHDSIVEQINAHHKLLPSVNRNDISMDFLPQSHIFEKMWVYFCLSLGVRTVIVTDPQQVRKWLPIVRPTLMCNVPRFWEKLYHGITNELEKRSKLQLFFFRHALAVGKRYQFNYRHQHSNAPLYLHLLNRFYTHFFFRQMKMRVGLQRARLLPTAGAYLSDTINTFLQTCGFPIILGYGLSETCASVAIYPKYGFKIGSVGEVLPQVQVRIDPETNEIQLKGNTITTGYYNNAKATEAAFTSDGWFCTGDAGHLEGRTLYFHERIKDLFKTANGKYIAPQQIENLLRNDAFIEQVACIADRKQYPPAIVYPYWPKLIEHARIKGLITGNETPEELTENQHVKNLLMARIEQLQGGLALYEKVKKIALIAQPFTEQKGEITATLKLRRKVINQNYKQQIDGMYNNH